jgi:organic radical activating enzyme
MNAVLDPESLVQAAWDLVRQPLSVTVADEHGSGARVVQGGRAWLRVTATAPPQDDVAVACRTLEKTLRHLGSEATLMAAGIDRGFRIEDLVLLQWGAPPAQLERALAWWRRRLGSEVVVHGVEAPVPTLTAVLAERGAAPTSQRQTYARDPSRGERVRVEAFELHVTEHCNLRCAHCCNSSPYVAPKTLAPAQIASTLARVADVLHADVFKIMGGEPLLHPEITEVLRVVRQSGVGDVVRLFTNGLLLHKQDDDFWRALDHLTVSSYASAPVRPEHLAHIEEQCRRFDVVLNVKPVAHFSQVMTEVHRPDDDAVQRTFDGCWLRHRCLVARDDRFFICTRAAYLPDVHERVALTGAYADPLRRRDEDSVPLDHPQLGDAILRLLNRTTPLHACRFCLGGDGPREEHTQLGRDDVRAGRVRRLKVLQA